MTLKQARKKVGGITQKELADMLGITSVTIGNWESGRCNPSVAIAMKVGEVLGIAWYEIEYTAR